jgi:N-acetylneuraminic acid mutarotase
MKGPIQLAYAETVALGWSYTGSLKTPRAGHTATLLPDGKVLVAGGSNFSGDRFQSLEGTELYDPATGKWNATGRLNVLRGGHTATLLKDGKVLIVGGSDGQCFNSAELYDPKDERWSVTGSLNTPRCFHTATLLKNGKVLVVGGDEHDNFWDFEPRPLDTVELYDPDTGMWSFTGHLNTGVESHTATLLQNGKVLVLGVRSTELYDPDTGIWSSVGSVGGYIGRAGHTATLLPDGRVLIVGGDPSPGGPIPPAQLYDPGTDEWSITGHLIHYEARVGHTANLLPDGKVLVAGGSGVFGGDAYSFPLRSSELYDPDTGTWSFASDSNTPRSSHTATLLPDGKPLLVGGRGLPPENCAVNCYLRVLASVELFGHNIPEVAPPKITMASVAGKKLIVVGENFDPDAVILINGEEQKTRNDGQNPQTTLIGKKAGKKIRPGDRLQVRNPDDTLSEEFIFTGS